MRLEGRRIAVTGGSGGIGHLVTRRLLDLGGDVLLIGRTRPHDLPVSFLEGDLATETGINAVAAALRMQAPEILINLAGVQYAGPLDSQNEANVFATYLVNLVAPVRLTQAVLPHMLRRRCGQIVNVGSVLGSINFPYFVTYSSAKAGLRGFTEGLRRELRGAGVHVTYVAPRAVSTGMTRGAVERFAKVTGMRLDKPERTVAAIIKAMVNNRSSVVIGLPEALLTKLNSIAPALVDLAVAGAAAKASRIFRS